MLSTKLLEAAGNSTQPTYIEDVFSTYLYTGNSSTQTITNSIDLSTKGGLVWMKERGFTGNHNLIDTARGIGTTLFTNSTAAFAANGNQSITSFNTTGFTLGTNAVVNASGSTFVSWTFRKQPKFFDVVTYTGDGSASPRQISHSLGSVPGFIVIKRTDTTSDWTVWHRSVTGNAFLQTNDAWLSGYTRITTPDATTFTVGASTMVNASGGSYVAYLFAHNAGGFGLTGTDNVISCGSYTGNGSTTGPTVTLGYEPQYLMIKNASGTGNWQIIDNMRGMPVGSADATLQPNLSSAESSVEYVSPTATGFQITSTSTEVNTNTSTYIYIAIRRGPMKVPTDGTKVFLPTTYASPGLNVQSTVTTNFPIDLNICGARGANNGYTYKFWFTDRLRVSSGTSTSNSLLTAGAGGTPNETAYNGLATFKFDNMTGYSITDSNGSFNGYSSGALTFGYDLRRAPGFMDEVCYSGTGSNASIPHNLTVAPELYIVKLRSSSGSGWVVGSTQIASTDILVLNTTNAASNGTHFQNSYPTASNLLVSNLTSVNASGSTYVAYLFASCPGVSKVGSYTGNGTTQTINCGFTAGARFVMIKRTDAAGEWYVWDSARGIVPSNDPYLSFSSQNSEDWAGASDSVDADTSGFIVNQNATNDVNVNGASYIYLAIA